ncbi:hypothetical protein PISMIDRAFT_19410 [Pisolithus microcarpus 441]|uniref:Uncharacterized protein n=1 Tax=Pisolithus microcarpus 441 TaxID=765257 RepID=A0A0C9Y3A9_9AGAM|nr:hypothetical protein PISMIDRAFT_19410 [Pisolithus microcarpus 441]
MASIADEESTARCVCSCSKYNFGKPHTVSLATWYRHIDEAQTETEKQRIRSARVCQATPHLTGPVSVRGRAATIQAMAKRCIETVEDVRHQMGRRKRARVQHGGNPSHTPDLSHPAQDDEDTLPHTPDLPDPALDNEDTFLHTPDLPHPALDNEDTFLHTPDLPHPALDNEDNCPPLSTNAGPVLPSTLKL